MTNKEGFVTHLFLTQNEHGIRKKSTGDDYYLADYSFTHDSPIPLTPVNEWECALTSVSLPTDRICVFGTTDDFFTVTFKSGRTSVINVRVPVRHLAVYDRNEDVAKFIEEEFKNNAQIRHWFRTDYAHMFKIVFRDDHFRILFTTTQYRDCVLDIGRQLMAKLGFSRNTEFPRPSNLEAVTANSMPIITHNSHFVLISIPSIIGPDTLINQKHTTSMACIPLTNPHTVNGQHAEARFDVYFEIASPVYHRITASYLTQWRAQILCASDMNIAKWAVSSDGVLMLRFNFRRRALFRTT